MNTSQAAIGLVIASLFSVMSDSHARVYAPRIVSEHNADAYSMKTFADYPAWRYLSGDQKAWAMFEYLTDYETGLYPMGTGAFEGNESLYEYSLVRDPVKMINGYSIGYCDVFGPVMAGIWEDAGIGKARVINVPWNDHVTTEVYYDDSWHYLDLDLRAAFLRDDGSLASMEDSRNTPSLWDKPNGPRFFPLDDLNVIREAYEQSDLQNRYGVAESGHTMDFILRQGESFTRWWEPQGGRWLHHPNYELEPFIGERLELEPRGPKSKHVGFTKYTHGNGQFFYQPDLRQQSTDLADGLYDSQNVESDSNGLTLSESGTGYAVFEIHTPYVIVPLVGEFATTQDDVEASVINIDATNAQYSISLDNGITWESVQAAGSTIDLTQQVAGKYGYLFKIELTGQPGDAIIRTFDITTWVQLAPASLPSLRVGSNKMQFRTNDHYGLPTRVVQIQPDTSSADDFYKHVVVAPTEFSPESSTSRIHGPFVVGVEAPPNTSIAWFSAGGSFESYQLGFAPFTSFTMEYAAGLPVGFTEIYSADMPDDMEHWHSNAQREVVLDEPADAIYLRYEGEPAVNNIRIFAHVTDNVEQDNSPVNIIHRWSENGELREFSTSSDQGNEYFIDVDNTPVHRSITMSVDSQYELDGGLSTISWPLAGQVLSGNQTTFFFSPGNREFNEWRMTLGQDPATAQGLYDSGIKNLDANPWEQEFGPMPTDGEPVYLRFWQRLSGDEWDTFDTEYNTAFVEPPVVTLTQPAPESRLSGVTQLFAWQDSGTSARDYWLSVGSSVGGSQYFNSGNLADTTSIVAGGLPADGSSTVYVRLWYRTGSNAWLFIDETYQAGTGAAAEPAITNIPPQSQFSDPQGTETITWEANGSGAIEYWIYGGNTQGGKQYFDSGNLGDSQSINISGLPFDGSSVWVRLWYRSVARGTWNYIDHEYTAANLIPQISVSGGGEVLASPDDTFSWSGPEDLNPEWWLYIGSSPGASDIEDSRSLGNAVAYQTTNSALPTGGVPVFVRLWYRQGTESWRFVDQVFESAP